MGTLRPEKELQGKNVMDRPFWGPHRAGFGPLPDKDLKHRPPPANGMGEGIMWKSPIETRDDIGGAMKNGEDHRCVDGTGEDFPPLIQQGRSRSHSTSSPLLQPTNPRVEGRSPEKPQTSFQPQIDRFVGYFRREQRAKPQSYAQAVQFEPPTMVHPEDRARGGAVGAWVQAAVDWEQDEMDAELVALGRGHLCGKDPAGGESLDMRVVKEMGEEKKRHTEWCATRRRRWMEESRNKKA
jgi:hypothetical protein